MRMAPVRNSIFFFTLVFLVSAAHAASRIYKSVDAEGNAIFTDIPPSNDEKKAEVELGEINEFPTTRQPKAGAQETRRTRVADSGENEEDVGPPTYDSLQVTSPKYDLSIRENSGNISISVSLSPELSSQHGHALEILMDDQVLASADRTFVDLENVDRGTRTVIARVIDEQGGTLITSEPVSFHMLRSSVN